MRLRNKKTGEIITLKDEGELALLKLIENSLPNGLRLWEEVKEPLIKDEKIRKAVRAWYDAIDYHIDKLLCVKGFASTKLEISDGSSQLYISLFVDKGTLANIKDRTYYTIAELCGEEEE